MLCLVVLGFFDSGDGKMERALRVARGVIGTCAIVRREVHLLGSNQRSAWSDWHNCVWQVRQLCFKIHVSPINCSSGSGFNRTVIGCVCHVLDRAGLSDERNANFLFFATYLRRIVDYICLEVA